MPCFENIMAGVTIWLLPEVIVELLTLYLVTKRRPEKENGEIRVFKIRPSTAS